MNKRARKLAVAVIAIAVVGMLVAAAVIVWVLLSYEEGQEAYDQVAQLAFETPLSDMYSEEDSAEDDFDDIDLSSLSVDWDALLATNPDTVGWIFVPGTVIDYPVVHSSDNNEYLYINFNGQRANGGQATYGTPFLLAENAADFSDLNNVIQAHNMSNGSMFAWIGNSALQDHSALQEHRSIYLLTPTANYRLSSISVVVCNADDPVTRTSFSSQDDFATFVQSLIDRSSVDLPSLGFEAADVGKIVSLSTCTSDGTNRRCVLVCAVTGYFALQQNSEESSG